MIAFTIRPDPPFRLDLTVRALRRLPVNLIDRWDGKFYSRIWAFNAGPAEVTVSQSGSAARPVLSVKVKSRHPQRIKRSDVEPALEKILGLSSDLKQFYALASRHRKLGSIIERYRGLKPPRFPSVFEALLNGFSCQQLSLNAGLHLLGCLSERYGLKMGKYHAFPRPQDLADADPRDLKGIGYSRNKSKFILNAAQDIASGKTDMEALENLDNALVYERLLKIFGVGRWTAEYVLLRGLGRLDVIPADDVGIRNKLQDRLDLKKPPNPDSIRKILSGWGAFKGALYFYLLIDSLERKAQTKDSKEKNKEVLP